MVAVGPSNNEGKRNDRRAAPESSSTRPANSAEILSNITKAREAQYSPPEFQSCPHAFHSLFHHMWGLVGEVPARQKVLEIGPSAGAHFQFYTPQWLDSLVVADRNSRAIELLAESHPQLPSVHTRLQELAAALSVEHQVAACIGGNTLPYASGIEDLRTILTQIDTVLSRHSKRPNIIHYLTTMPPDTSAWGGRDLRTAAALDMLDTDQMEKTHRLFLAEFKEAVTEILSTLGYEAAFRTGLKAVNVAAAANTTQLQALGNLSKFNTLALHPNGKNEKDYYTSVQGTPIRLGEVLEVVEFHLLHATKAN